MNFADQEVSFAWRSYFIAASTLPLTEAVRETAGAKGWTLFELPEKSALGVPEAMISMFKD